MILLAWLFLNTSAKENRDESDEYLVEISRKISRVKEGSSAKSIII